MLHRKASRWALTISKGDSTTSEQLVLVLCHSQIKEVLSHIHVELPTFQVVPVSPCPERCQEPGLIHLESHSTLLQAEEPRSQPFLMKCSSLLITSVALFQRLSSSSLSFLNCGTMVLC